MLFIAQPMRLKAFSVLFRKSFDLKLMLGLFSYLVSMLQFPLVEYDKVMVLQPNPRFKNDFFQRVKLFHICKWQKVFTFTNGFCHFNFCHNRRNGLASELTVNVSFSSRSVIKSPLIYWRYVWYSFRLWRLFCKISDFSGSR